MGWPLTGNNLSRFNRLLDDLRQYGDFPLVGSPDDITWLWQIIREASDGQFSPELDDVANRSHYWMLRLVSLLGDRIVPPTPPTEQTGVHWGPDETTIDVSDNGEFDLYYLTYNDPTITSLTFDSLETMTGGGFTGTNNTFLTFFSAPKLINVLGDVDFSGQNYTSLSFPVLTNVSGRLFANTIPLIFLDVSKLETVGDFLDIVDAVPLVHAEFTALKSVGLITSGVTYYAAYSCPNLTTLLHPALEEVDNALVIFDCPLLTTLEFPSLLSANIQISDCASLISLSLPLWGGLAAANPSLDTIVNNTSLTTVNVPSWFPPDGTGFVLSGNAFSAPTVNHILARCVANPAFVSGSVDLSG